MSDKKKIIFYILLCMMLGGMAGCGKAVEEAGHSAAQQTEKQETGNSAMQETEKQGTNNSTVQGAENSSTGSTKKEKTELEKTGSALENGQNTIILTDIDPAEEYINYKMEDYGIIEEKRQEYQEYETDRTAYYYEMENFFFDGTFPNADAINQTLQGIYDAYEKGYQEGAEEYRYGIYGEDTEEFPTEYDLWHLLSLTYIGDDYVSLQYNSVSYMGGAHPYSYLVGITINCKTGKQVSAPQILGEDYETILTKAGEETGLDVIRIGEDWDFYLTDSYIVLFYRYPGFWDEVVLLRS